jgi:hypothetical protein
MTSCFLVPFSRSLLVVDADILVVILVGDRNEADLVTKEACQVDLDLQSMSKFSNIAGSLVALQACYTTLSHPADTMHE